MKSFKQSIYDPEHTLLREWLIDKRKSNNMSQRQLAERLDVVHSLVGKVENGERRLDVIEFINYCQALDANPSEVINLITKAKKG